jgi:Effector Associated Constant Component 1
MDVSIAVSGPDAADELRSLQAWLAEDEELRGRVRLAGGSPRPETLGPAAETLAIALGPGGLSASVATGLVAWLRHRTSDVTVVARGRAGREVRVSARRVRTMTPEQLRELAAILAAGLGEPD